MTLFDDAYFDKLEAKVGTGAGERGLPAVARAICAALEMHHEGLERASKASDRHADGLKKATWALVAAMGALVLVSLIQLLAR